MAGTIIKASAFASLCAIFIALFVRKHMDDMLRDRLTAVLQGLEEVEKKFPAREIGSARIAVGYGACNDLFVNAEYVLEFEDTAKDPEHFSVIKSYEQLLKAYAYFFRHGAAAERFMVNRTLFQELIHKAEYSPGVRYSLGGNAPVMAIRFLNEGFEVFLGAHITEQLARKLPEGIRALRQESSKDDTHLILEYKAEEEWGIYTAPRANRFILHSDELNPMMMAVEEFEPYLREFNPHLFVVGGLQMMDSFPFRKGMRQMRLKAIRDQMAGLPKETKIHFEMASFTEEILLKELTEYIIPYADSLGMNEQELANLFSILVYGNISLVSDSIPRVATVLDDMRKVFTLVRNLEPSNGESKNLTRLHVHTLAYQAIMTVKGSWKNSKGAAAKASLTAYRHVCESTKVDLESAMLILDESFSTSKLEQGNRVLMDNNSPVPCWEEIWEDGLVMQICVAPVLVCTNAMKTAGGGDNISAAALALQI